MHKEKKLTKNIWILIMIFSLLLTIMPLIKITELALTGSGSSFIPQNLDEDAFASFKLIMIFWLMYLIISGFLGLFCSWGLKKKELFAWKLGVFWSVLLIIYGIIASVIEILICWVHKPIARYTLTSDKLIAHCGPFTNIVTLDAIETISPSRSPLASPACSLDRLHIVYSGSKSGLLVSPIDKHAFLETLVARCSNLELKGDSVVRRDT